MTRIAINGVGRIGRAFLKLAVTRPELDVVALNDLADPAAIAYLMRYDSAYGRYTSAVSAQSAPPMSLTVGGKQISYFQERSPDALPWSDLKIDVVVEATGAFARDAEARAHIPAGARRVVLAPPAKDEDAADARTVLIGVNPQAVGESIVTSNGSCPTNSASPVI